MHSNGNVPANTSNEFDAAFGYFLASISRTNTWGGGGNAAKLDFRVEENDIFITRDNPLGELLYAVDKETGDVYMVHTAIDDDENEENRVSRLGNPVMKIYDFV